MQPVSIDLSSSPPDDVQPLKRPKRTHPSSTRRLEPPVVDLSTDEDRSKAQRGMGAQQEAAAPSGSSPEVGLAAGPAEHAPMLAPSERLKRVTSPLWGEIQDDDRQPDGAGGKASPRYAPPSARFWNSRHGSRRGGTHGRQASGAEAAEGPSGAEQASDTAAAMAAAGPFERPPRAASASAALQRPALGAERRGRMLPWQSEGSGSGAGPGPAAGAPAHEFSGRPRYARMDGSGLGSWGSVPGEGARSRARHGGMPSGASREPAAGASDAACDAELARKLQEEEDRHVAHEVSRRMEMEDDRRMQARLNAWEALEEESEQAHEQALASLAGLSRRSRSSRSAAPMFDPAAAMAGGRSGAAGAGFGAAAAAAIGSGGFGGGGGGGWGPMSLSALLLGGAFQGRHQRRGGPGNGARDMRDMVAGLVDSGLPPQLLFSDRDFTADDYEALLRLDDKVENRKGATQQDIDALPTHVVRDSGRSAESEKGCPQTCPICLEDVVPGAILRLLPCAHQFHQNCIDDWLKQKAACPICQKQCNEH